MDVFSGRVAEVPLHLAETANLPWDRALSALTDDVVVTGVGASSGPARILAFLLSRRRNLSVRFSPLSAFLSDDVPGGGTLVLFSQGLSPNACLALRRADRFSRVLVITSVPEASHALLSEIARRNGVICLVPPTSETGTFLRVIGPATATLAAIVLGERAAGNPIEAPTRDLLEALGSAGARAEAATQGLATSSLDTACAFLSVGVDPIVWWGLRWKWLEGLRRGEPPALDALEVVHGPLQGAVARFPCLFLESAGDGSAFVVPRLRDVLSRTGHPLVSLSSPLRFPWSFLDLDHQLNRLLVRVLTDHPRDLSPEGCAIPDEPLYGLGRPTPPTTPVSR